MIDRVRGKLLEKKAGQALVEVGGFGILVKTPLTTFLELPDPPAEISLLTTMVIREESWELFGFLTMMERESFTVLTSVSRVGPRLALSIISAMEPGELARTLMEQDLNRLSAIKGIGLKTAERLLVELKDKAPRLAALNSDGKPTDTSATPSSNREEACLALINLGWSRNEAERAIKTTMNSVEAGADLGLILREALKILSS